MGGTPKGKGSREKNGAKRTGFFIVRKGFKTGYNEGGAAHLGIQKKLDEDTQVLESEEGQMNKFTKEKVWAR